MATGKAVPQEKSSERVPNGKNERSVFDALLQDHGAITALIEKIVASSKEEVERRQELYTRVELELLVHMEAEERFLYSALEQHDESREKVLESYQEHQVIKTVIGTFVSLAVDDERWAPKVKVLQDLVRHHMDREEQELFTMAAKVLGREQLSAISVKVQELKRGKKPEGSSNSER